MKRYALALWFAGLALLGFVRSYAAIARHGAFDGIAVLWLGGSSLMAAIALVLAIRAARG